MKKHDKKLSTFSFYLEKKMVKDNDFSSSFSSFSTSEIGTCGIWGAHSYALTRSHVASDALKCHIWQAHSIALTGQENVKETEVIDYQPFPKTLIFRVFAHDELFFQKTSLLVAPKFRIFLTIEEGEPK